VDGAGAERGQDPEETEIMERVRCGDVAAFEQLLGRFWTPTLRYARSLIDDEDHANDVAQECFVRLWQRKHEWKCTGSVGIWLLRTARNLTISEQRRGQTRTRWAARLGWEENRRPRTPLQEVERAELRGSMERAIGLLSPRRREVFTLFHLQNFSYREIAEIMEIRPQTVANYLQAAMADLRASLKPFYPSLASAPGPDGPDDRIP
jgi:RNA polymerase sigma-70 factor, ECF subfamily